MVERKPEELSVVGSIPTLGTSLRQLLAKWLKSGFVWLPPAEPEVTIGSDGLRLKKYTNKFNKRRSLT